MTTSGKALHGRLSLCFCNVLLRFIEEILCDTIPCNTVTIPANHYLVVNSQSQTRIERTQFGKVNIGKVT